MKEYLFKDLKSWFSRFLTKHRTIKLIFIAIGSLVIIYFFLGQVFGNWVTITNFFNSCSSEKTEEELTIEWLEENFTDTTYNVLLLPFNDFQESSEKRVEIEQALEQRLDDLRNRYFFSTNVKSSIKVKCYLEMPEFLSIDSISAIGIGVKADLVIYVDIYDLYDKPAKRTNIKYIILQETKRGFPFKKSGETGLIEFNSLSEIREGYLIKDIDYLAIWIYCNKQLNQKSFDNALVIWNSIETNFNEPIFNKNSSFLAALIGADYYSLGDLFNSKKFLLKSKTIYEFAEILSLLGLVYSDLDELDSSKYYQTRAYELKPNSYMVNLNLANLYVDIRKYNKAKYHYKKAIQLDESKDMAYFNLGLLYGRYLSLPDSAFTYFSNAIKLNPDSSVIFYRSIGMSYIEQDLKKSKYYLLMARTINTKDAITNYELGRVYEIENKIDSAKNFYQIAIQSDPNYAFAHNNLGLLYKNNFNQPDSAYHQFRIAIKINPYEAKYYYNIGLLHQHNYLNPDSATIYFKKALELNPEYENATYSIADIYRDKIVNIDSARYYYERTIKINPNNTGAHNNLAAILDKHYKEYKLAKIHYEEAIKLNHQLGEAHYNYAVLLFIQFDDKPKAKEHYLIALKLDEKFRDKYLDDYFKIQD